ncbi:uncharacterized protein EDB91DRAFT_315538 [Suillus paluster]|uniref:uncharacterized protein n=1 Tax=Suillus paluster TaxID=48578 RepID=UPI001B862468|nr:uncharacterized protein EDB91DRAFT_315538 [Suillus paluster]KAG1741801.1 hypothetical protein EDB91DRAFT_315538 [Suillus paluster]
MVPLIFYLFVSISSIIPSISTILAVQVHPDARAVTSAATCVDGYLWMNDAQGYSPCLTVAYVGGACIGNVYNQLPLTVGNSYTLPNSSNADACYCSWSSYNLLMACTLCQGPNFTNSVWTWARWASGCTTNSSWTQEYFPSGGYELAGNASIPYWATTNPTTWTYATFNIQDANATYQQSGSSSSSKSIDVGVIVGGAAALLLVAIGAYLLYRRHVYKKGAYAAIINQKGTASHNLDLFDSSNLAPSTFGPAVLYGQSLSSSQQYSPQQYSPQPQRAYPSLQSSFSPPPWTDTFVYTTHTSSGQPSEAIPMI